MSQHTGPPQRSIQGITASQVEYEIEGLNREGVTRIVLLDGVCFSAWLSQTDKNS